MNKTFRAALVGCGTISQNHLSALRDNGLAEIVALCDKRAARAEAKRDEFAPDAAVYTDYITMLDTVKPDCIHICTPHYLHADMAIKALRRDINVFLEKPMCISLEECVAILEAEKKSLAHITVCFQNRYNPSTEEALKLISEDGGAISAYGSVFWERNEAYYKESDWRGRIKTEGGGVLINQAIHMLDLLVCILGKPMSVTATKANHHLKGVIDVEDSAEGIIKFENGRIGNFYATTSFVGYDSISIFIKTPKRRIEIRNGNLFVNNEPYLSDGAAFVGKQIYGDSHRILINEFYSALMLAKDTPVPPSSAQYAVRILLAAYNSNDTETPV